MLHRLCLLLYAHPFMFPSGLFSFFFFASLPVLDEMLSNEALCWKDDTYTPEIFILHYLQGT